MVASRIAIDGDAAAGKTVTGKEVARRLGYLFFETGAMYRALGLLALRSGTPLDDEDALRELLDEHAIDVRPAPSGSSRPYEVLLDGDDVTAELRAPAVDDAASRVAVHPSVRRHMVAIQREYGRRGRVVMVGRDIGSVVMPDAELKLYLTASVDERVRRRLAELRDRGVRTSEDRVRRELAERDSRDASRAASPMQVAEGALVLNTDGKSVGDVVAEIVRLARER